MARFGMVGLVALVLLLAGCQHPPDGVDQRTWQPGQSGDNERDERLEPIMVRTSGYGAYEVTPSEATAQDHLRVRRASKLDAYRSLAERVYGTTIHGTSTVNEFVLLNDHYRAYVDSYIRGAKVVSVIEHPDGVVETVMQLRLEPRFRRCVADMMPDEARKHCPIPMPRGQDAPPSVVSSGNNKSSPDSLYYLE